MRNRDAKANRDVAAWTHPVGTVVYVTRDNGEVQRTKTRSTAAVMGGSAVIWLEGIAGCYSLSRVRAADDFPKRIPRKRAVAALELANAILDYEEGAEPADSAGDHTVTVEADTWQEWLKLARTAAADADKEAASNG